MFSKIIQLLLVTTAISPVLLTLWFKSISNNWCITCGWYFILPAVFLLLILYMIIQLAKRKLEKIPIEISEIATADHESIAFIFTYLLPLFDIDISMVIFLLVFFFLIIFTANIYHFNPMVGLLGYHQYQIKLKEGTSFILITRRTLINTKQINEVVQLTDYILLDRGDKI